MPVKLLSDDWIRLRSFMTRSIKVSFFTEVIKYSIIVNQADVIGENVCSQACFDANYAVQNKFFTPYLTTLSDLRKLSSTFFACFCLVHLCTYNHV